MQKTKSDRNLLTTFSKRRPLTAAQEARQKRDLLRKKIIKK